MSEKSPPNAIRWPLLVAAVLIGVVAVLIGAGLAVPIRATIARVGNVIGIGPGHAEAPDAPADDSEAVQYYTCGMHPWVILPKPGDCPICHMELTPIDPDKFTGEITIDPVVVQNMGVRIAPVVTGPLTRRIRTVGTIDYNERAVRDINIKVDGWIENLYVDYLGARVKQGDALFDLYSPQLYAAQEEFLLALRGEGRIGSPVAPEASQGAVNLLRDARTRLEYFDITDDQIDQLRESGEPSKAMTIRSPYTGVVIEKHANEGMKVDPGMRVFRIADLSKVWVMVTLYEYQLPYVEVGQNATMQLPYIPGQAFEGKVIYIYPYLDQKTREVQVRLEFDNPTDLLKPGMFATVALENTLAAEKTLAPRSAIIDTGERQVAFVSQGEGKFEPRNVQLGIETGDGMVEIRSGLKPGEMVVTSGQFLIDSEAKIREALAKMIKGDLASEQTVTAQVVGTSELTSLPPDVAGQLNSIIEHYFAIGDRLAGDTFSGIGSDADAVADGLNELVKADIPDDAQFWRRHQDALATARASALKLADANDLAQARLDFAELSIALESLVKATGIPPSFRREVQVLHCPMYRQGQGGTIWLQQAGAVRNPYFGSTMLECFDKRSAIPVTGAVPARDERTGKAMPGTETEAPVSPAKLDQASQERIDEVVEAYLSIQQMLTEDQWENAADDLSTIRQNAEELSGSAVDTLSALAEQVVDKSAINAEQISGFRDGFFELSKAVLALVQTYPPDPQAVGGLYHVYCPMVKKDWLQASNVIRNPYDPSMLECGTIEQQILPTPEIQSRNEEME